MNNTITHHYNVDNVSWTAHFDKEHQYFFTGYCICGKAYNGKAFDKTLICECGREITHG